MPKPMLTEDYLLRIINQAVSVLLAIARLKSVGQYQEAQQYINQSLEQLIGLPANLINGLEDDVILNTLLINGLLDTARLLIVADLFKEEGDILAAQNKIDESMWSYQRALFFYLKCELDDVPKSQPNPNEKIENIASLLANVENPIETELLLSYYFEQVGNYAQGYHVLSKLSNTPKLQGEAIEIRIAYLQRVLDRSKEEISEGWMSREEIEREITILQGKIER